MMIRLFFGLCALGTYLVIFFGILSSLCEALLEWYEVHATTICSVVNRTPGLAAAAAAAARALLGVHHVDKVGEWAADRPPTSATLDWPPSLLHLSLRAL